MFIKATNNEIYNLSYLRKIVVVDPATEATRLPLRASSSQVYSESLWHVHGYFGESNVAVELVATGSEEEAQEKADALVKASGGYFSFKETTSFKKPMGSSGSY